jgi:hypothetical protein
VTYKSRLGRKQRVVGISFSALAIALLIFGYYTNYIVLEVDSIICFIASIFLLFSNTSVRMDRVVLEAALRSSSRTISQLEKNNNQATYVKTGNNLSDIYLVEDGIEGMRKIIPPGRDLALLFQRELGDFKISYDILDSKLGDILSNSFMLCESARIEKKDSHFRVTLQNPSYDCGCSDSSLPGSSGCAVSSMVAILICEITSKPVRLVECKKDIANNVVDIVVFPYK